MQVQAETMHNADVMTKLAAKVEKLDTDVHDTQQLLGALQGLPSRPCPSTAARAQWHSISKIILQCFGKVHCTMSVSAVL